MKNIYWSTTDNGFQALLLGSKKYILTGIHIVIPADFLNIDVFIDVCMLLLLLLLCI